MCLITVLPRISHIYINNVWTTGRFAPTEAGRWNSPMFRSSVSELLCRPLSASIFPLSYIKQYKPSWWKMVSYLIFLSPSRLLLWHRSWSVFKKTKRRLSSNVPPMTSSLMSSYSWPVWPVRRLTGDISPPAPPSICITSRPGDSDASTDVRPVRKVVVGPILPPMIYLWLLVLCNKHCYFEVSHVSSSLCLGVVTVFEESLDSHKHHVRT